MKGFIKYNGGLTGFSFQQTVFRGNPSRSKTKKKIIYGATGHNRDNPEGGLSHRTAKVQ